MKMIFFLIPSLSFAFTLSNSTWFDKPDIKIEIAGTSCQGAGMSTSKFKKLVQKAADDYWNAVPTSALKLSVGSVGSKDIDGLTINQIINNLVDNGEILAGCSDDIDGFDGSSEPGGVSGILGVGTISCSGSNCRGVFILNTHATSQVSDLGTSDLVATIAHEIGHAIGLGHSEYKHNLMYYSIGGKTQKWLGEDDIDGVNYLYPHDPQMGGLLGACGTIAQATDDENFPGGPFALSFLIGIILFASTAILMNSVNLKT